MDIWPKLRPQSNPFEYALQWQANVLLMAESRLPFTEQLVLAPEGQTRIAWYYAHGFTPEATIEALYAEGTFRKVPTWNRWRYFP